MANPASAAMAAKKKRAAGNDPAKVQLTPLDWINAATSLLVEKSIDAVGVDALAKQLGVTRGSFYWHFTNREDLLNQILNNWKDRATDNVIRRFTREGVKPQELIAELTLLPFHGHTARESASLELAIRAWARRDPDARQVVDQVDAERLSYISQCFSALGHDIAEARARAFALYAYMMSESLLYNQGSDIEKEARRRFMETTLLAGEKQK